MITPQSNGRRPARNERGQALSSFIAVVAVALFLTAGLVIDGGAKSSAARVAQGAAAEAARAGVDAGASAQAAGDPVNVGEIRSAAHQVLASRGVTGSVTIRNGVVRVTTSKTVDTVFLGLIGINTLTAHGESASELYTS